MGVYIIFGQDVPNTTAYRLMKLSESAQLDYYSDYTDSTETAQYVAVGPVTEGDMKNVCSCLSGCKYVVMEAKSIDKI